MFTWCPYSAYGLYVIRPLHRCCGPQFAPDRLVFSSIWINAMWRYFWASGYERDTELAGFIPETGGAVPISIVQCGIERYL